MGGMSVFRFGVACQRRVHSGGVGSPQAGVYMHSLKCRLWHSRSSHAGHLWMSSSTACGIDSQHQGRLDIWGAVGGGGGRGGPGWAYAGDGILLQHAETVWGSRGVSNSLIRVGKRWRVTPWIVVLRLEGSLQPHAFNL